MKKKYGQSQILKCHFCDKQATLKNQQGLPTCIDHRKSVEQEKKCVCGEKLKLMNGKYGPFYLCDKCGPVSLKKVKEFDNSDYKLNKSFRKEEKIYTLKELEEMWDNEST